MAWPAPGAPSAPPARLRPPCRLSGCRQCQRRRRAAASHPLVKRRSGGPGVRLPPSTSVAPPRGVGEDGVPSCPRSRRGRRRRLSTRRGRIRVGTKLAGSSWPIPGRRVRPRYSVTSRSVGPPGLPLGGHCHCLSLASASATALACQCQCRSRGGQVRATGSGIRTALRGPPPPGPAGCAARVFKLGFGSSLEEQQSIGQRRASESKAQWARSERRPPGHCTTEPAARPRPAAARGAAGRHPTRKMTWTRMKLGCLWPRSPALRLLRAGSEGHRDWPRALAAHSDGPSHRARTRSHAGGPIPAAAGRR